MLYLYGVGGDFRREASGRLHALLGDDSFAGWRRFYTVGAALYGIGKKGSMCIPSGICSCWREAYSIFSVSTAVCSQKA